MRSRDEKADCRQGARLFKFSHDIRFSRIDASVPYPHVLRIQNSPLPRFFVLILYLSPDLFSYILSGDAFSYTASSPPYFPQRIESFASTPHPRKNKKKKIQVENKK